MENMKKNAYTCITTTESLGCTVEINTTLEVIHTLTNLKTYSRTSSKNYKGAESKLKRQRRNVDKLTGFPEEGIEKLERDHKSHDRRTSSFVEEMIVTLD